MHTITALQTGNRVTPRCFFFVIFMMLLTYCVLLHLYERLTFCLLMCIQAGALSQDIGVISIYRQQLKVISSLLQQTSSEDVVRDGKSSSCASTTATSMSNAIEVNTVDRYQGRDKPCVIVSLVRSNATGKVRNLFPACLLVLIRCCSSIPFMPIIHMDSEMHDE